MKVLLSAYACEPGKGSEPGVGWHWAIEIARLGHDVHVITRRNNRATIEAAQATGDVPRNLTFHYYDLKPWQNFWKKGNRGVHLYTILWQWGASQLALELHKRCDFDLVHHITFASIRLPSFMWRLGIPFIFGPAGGGEAAPHSLRRGFPLSGKVKDWLRDVSNSLIPYDPLMCKTFASAHQIWLRGRENRKFIPSRFEQKIRHDVGVGVATTSNATGTGPRPDNEFRVIYVGNFLYLKGMHIGLRAFNKAYGELKALGIPLTLTMVGDGPEETKWRSILAHSTSADAVRWLGRVPQDALPDTYRTHDVLLFPSLHDSAGMVIVEAALAGTPSLCLDIGGPGMLINESRGLKIAVEGLSEDQVITALADALVRLASDASLLEQLSHSAQTWARTMSWRNAVLRIYEDSDLVTAGPAAR